eukprot:494514-Rhodomonas_salina.1
MMPRSTTVIAQQRIAPKKGPPLVKGIPTRVPGTRLGIPTRVGIPTSVRPSRVSFDTDYF